MSSRLNTEIEKEVGSVVRELLEMTDNITINQDLESFGLNSLKLIKLIVRLEEVFNISFEDEELLYNYFSSIQNITDKVAEKL